MVHRECCSNSEYLFSITAGAATSIIFVVTKDMFCRDIIMFVATNILS